MNPKDAILTVNIDDVSTRLIKEMESRGFECERREDADGWVIHKISKYGLVAESYFDIQTLNLDPECHSAYGHMVGALNCFVEGIEQEHERRVEERM